MAKKKVKKSSSKLRSKPYALPKAKSLVKSLESRSDTDSSQLSTQSLSMKICRLCEANDGPFINIFDVEQSIQKKIDILLPFSVTESDGLPHNVCYRCSAKVEDSYEFVQKCICAQTNLCKVFRKEPQTIFQTKHPRKIWEEILVKANKTNEEVCNAVVRKAIEGIPGITLSPEPEPRPLTDVEEVTTRSKRKTRNFNENVYTEEVISSQTFTDSKVAQQSSNEPKRKTRSTPQTKTGLSEVSKLNAELNSTIELIDKPPEKPSPSTEPKPSESETTLSINTLSFDYDDKPQPEVKKQVVSSIKKKSNNPPKESISEEKNTNNDVIKILDDDNEQDTAKLPTKPVEPVTKDKKPAEKTTPPKDPNFNIMDHVSMIKVNGVGILFQCGLCNRNFLKKDVLQNHGCAKTGVAKPDLKTIKPIIDPPKNPMASVKFLTNKPVEQKSTIVEVEKPKPKAGPASKVKKAIPENMIGLKINPKPESSQLIQMLQTPATPPPISHSQISQPQIYKPQMTQPQMPEPTQNQFKPGSNIFKLIPGPNNSFTLVQDSETNKNEILPVENTINDSDSEPEIVPITKPGPKSRVRKFTRPKSNETPPQPTHPPQPYPVGLFAVNSNSEEIITPIQTQMTFGTQFQNPLPVYPQMQQHIYGNPIQQQHYQNQMVMQPQYGHQMQHQNFNNMMPQQNMQHNMMQQQNMQQNMMSQQNMQQNMQQNLMQNQYQHQQVVERPGAFTNPAVKKVTQNYTVVQTGHPSKLLISTRPRPNAPETGMHNNSSNNIIQESQITTSAADAYPYKCHMCPISFSRDKKLQTHLQGHYTKLEDPQVASRKRIKRV